MMPGGNCDLWHLDIWIHNTYMEHDDWNTEGGGLLRRSCRNTPPDCQEWSPAGEEWPHHPGGSVLAVNVVHLLSR
ncbi:unnamed protein product [Pylaiella littoralis]